ncbi:MAG TPA: hypothetical protein VHC96_05540 [Puia sp.]|jgi:hypothetical protein|nr:hypothetical protein [Puia sp.]
MEQEKYDIQKEEDRFVYWFFSEGPKGKILKRVQFQHMPELNRNAFNLTFGDWDESTGRLNDRVVSNNGDHLTVLRTVAEVVHEFINLWPDAIIQVQGSTPSRTRLYQISIASFWGEISRDFEIWGEVGEGWNPFRKGVNYKRFLIFKKIR